MSNTLSTPPTDTALIAAEQEIATLRARAKDLRAGGDRSDHPEITDRVFELEDKIAATPAATLAGSGLGFDLP